MAAIPTPIDRQQISQAEIIRLTQETPINVTTNTPLLGYNRKLQKIKEIMKKSAESQLLVAAYYNKLISDTNSDTTIYNGPANDGRNVVDYETYSVSVNTETSTIILNSEADIGTTRAFEAIPLVNSYNTQVRIIDTAISRAAAAGGAVGILDDGNTHDGGRPSLLLKSKKKKNKTSRTLRR